MALAWLIPVVPANFAALVISLALQFTGTATAPAMVPWLVAVPYSVVAFAMFLRHSHRAQGLVARRLRIDSTAERNIDFRGYEKFDRSIAAARGAPDSADRGAAH